MVARAEGGETHSQAYYIIKAAQKREELQRKGDQLDQDIRKCEKEIRALNTTLDHLNARNTAFRESFQKVCTLFFSVRDSLLLPFPLQRTGWPERQRRGGVEAAWRAHENE